MTYLESINSAILAIRARIRDLELVGQPTQQLQDALDVLEYL